MPGKEVEPDEISLGSQDTSSDDEHGCEESFIVMDENDHVLLQPTFENIDELFASLFELYHEMDSELNDLRERMDRYSRRIRALEHSKEEHKEEYKQSHHHRKRHKHH